MRNQLKPIKSQTDRSGTSKVDRLVRKTVDHPTKASVTLWRDRNSAVSLAITGDLFSRRDDAPATPDSRTGGVANEQIIVQVPNRCLACAGIVKQVVGSAVAIEIG